MRIHLILINLFLFSFSLTRAQWNTNSLGIHYNAGNVGVGTINPVSTLSVLKSSSTSGYGNIPAIEINNPNITGDAYSALILKSGTASSIIGINGAIGELFSYAFDNSTGRYMWLRTLGSSYKLYLGYNRNDLVISNGQVSIGTEDPNGYKLAVNGPAIFTKAVVKPYANWPDYVFNKDYPLMPLDSLEVYIQQNHHLPKITTADDVQNNGIDIGDTQTQLLQKIEELTLYLIDADKQLKQQIQVNDEQNKKIEMLIKENQAIKDRLGTKN